MEIAGFILFAAIVAGGPVSPAPSPTPNACGAGNHTDLLATENRPTIGFSACAVKRGEVLAEIGYSNQSGSVGLVQYPQGFMRYGLGRGIEVDFIGPAYELQRPGAQGFADSGVGAKWEFAQNVSSSAAMDFLYTAPTGAPAFTAGTPAQTLNLDYGRSISSRFGVATTAGILHMQSLVTLLPSVVVTDQYRTGEQLYAEAYGQDSLRPHGTLFGLDGGVQYLLGAQVVMDMEAGRTVAGQARSHYYGFGLGIRF